jgi:hypothetical protein
LFGLIALLFLLCQVFCAFFCRACFVLFAWSGSQVLVVVVFWVVFWLGWLDVVGRFECLVWRSVRLVGLNFFGWVFWLVPLGKVCLVCCIFLLFVCLSILLLVFFVCLVLLGLLVH